MKAEAVSDTQAQEPRQRIVEVAIQHFAERGFEGTSIRDITTEADCGVAAVNYYFGGKEKLYEEAFRGIFSEIQERRMAAIRSSMEAEPEMELEAFLHSFCAAFLEPLVSGGRGALFLSFLAREMSDQRMPPQHFVDEFIRPFMALSMDALSRFGPPMDDDNKLLCLMSVVGQLIHLVRVVQMTEHGGVRSPVHGGIEQYVEHIVRFSAAGIRAFAHGPRGLGSAHEMEA